MLINAGGDGNGTINAWIQINTAGNEIVVDANARHVWHGQ